MSKTIKQEMKDAHLWDVIKQDYHLDKMLGQGSYGKVMKCTCKKNGLVYAIKLMTDVFDDIHHLK
jgi:hypothetical protein